MVAYKSLVLLLASALSVSALPASDALEKRQTSISVKYCEDEQFRGRCVVATFPVNQCHNVDSAFNDKITSIINLDKSKAKCTWYEHAQCTGQKLQKDEDKKLQDGGGKFDNFISSVICAPK